MGVGTSTGAGLMNQGHTRRKTETLEASDVRSSVARASILSPFPTPGWNVDGPDLVLGPVQAAAAAELTVFVRAPCTLGEGSRMQSDCCG